MDAIVMVGKILFYICIAPLVIYSLKFYAVSAMSIFYRGRKPPETEITTDLPKVSIHIPVYNDPVVVECVKSCQEFDYPKDKYEIIVIDDSNDKVTSKALDKLKKQVGGFKILRRGGRRGFKAGALNDAAKISNGDMIVVFDSDYLLGADFLRKTVQPFLQDQNIAFVQTRWDYINPGKNRISRIAMISYNAFHQCLMPVKEKLGTAIFCGTGGAIRKAVLNEAGGWNEENVGEDIDLTVRILDKGYKQVYMPYVKARGEVPETLKAFVKQQQRWAYGTTKVMKDYLGKIMKSKKLSKTQKLDLFFIVTGFFVFPFILGVTISTLMVMSPWFGPNTAGEIFNLGNLIQSTSLAAKDFFSFEGFAILLLTTGYFFECALGLIYERKYKEILTLPWVFVLGFLMQVTNTIAVMKALAGVKYSFYKTPKIYYKGTT